MKNASGSGSIRRKEVVKNGKVYVFFEARYSYHGKQKSITGKTQAEVAQKLRKITAEIDGGDYREPSKLTVASWLDTWLADYCGSIKPRTKDSYEAIVNTHLKPSIGKIKLDRLTPADIQHLCNNLHRDNGKEPLSNKTIKNVHGTLHRALQKAVEIGLINRNPADLTELPKVVQKEIHPLDDELTMAFLCAIENDPYRDIFKVDLFTGMRSGEILGLPWNAVDFEKGSITIKQQLQMVRKSNGQYTIATPKNGKSRTIFPAPAVMAILKARRASQAEQKKEALKNGELWNNEYDLVFTDCHGVNLKPQTVNNHLKKKIMASIGFEEGHFHTLRHSFAVTSLKNGDDIKTVQTSLGHHTAAFTLQIYAHSTDEMLRNSGERMQRYFEEMNAKIG